MFSRAKSVKDTQILSLFTVNLKDVSHNIVNAALLPFEVLECCGFLAVLIYCWCMSVATSTASLQHCCMNTDNTFECIAVVSVEPLFGSVLIKVACANLERERERERVDSTPKCFVYDFWKPVELALQMHINLHVTLDKHADPHVLHQLCTS